MALDADLASKPAVLLVAEIGHVYPVARVHLSVHMVRGGGARCQLYGSVCYFAQVFIHRPAPESATVCKGCIYSEDFESGTLSP